MKSEQMPASTMGCSTSGVQPAAAQFHVPWLEAARLLGLSAMWLASSSGVILANRYIMVELHWPYAFAVSAMGMAVSGLFGFIVCDVLKMVPSADIDLQFYALRVFPIGALQALVMWLSNSLWVLAAPSATCKHAKLLLSAASPCKVP